MAKRNRKTDIKIYAGAARLDPDPTKPGMLKKTFCFGIVPTDMNPYGAMEEAAMTVEALSAKAGTLDPEHKTVYCFFFADNELEAENIFENMTSDMMAGGGQ